MQKLVKGFLLFTVSACFLGAEVSAIFLKPDGDTNIGFEEATVALSLAAKQSGKFTVYEGLPHFFEGREFVENEIRTKPTVLIDENWFYLPSQVMPAGDRSILQQLFLTGGFKPWHGVKLCGGFHADYAVSFESGGSNGYLVLFCFGCHEARILRMLPDSPKSQGAPGFRLTVDLTEDGYKSLQEFFKKYRKERPPMPGPKSKAKPPGPPRVPVRLSPGS